MATSYKTGAAAVIKTFRRVPSNPNQLFNMSRYTAVVYIFKNIFQFLFDIAIFNSEFFNISSSPLCWPCWSSTTEPMLRAVIISAATLCHPSSAIGQWCRDSRPSITTITQQRRTTRTLPLRLTTTTGLVLLCQSRSSSHRSSLNTSADPIITSTRPKTIPANLAKFIADIGRSPFNIGVITDSR